MSKFSQKQSEHKKLSEAEEKKKLGRMKREVEDFLNFDLKEIKPEIQRDAQVYLGLIRNIHSKKIKDYSYEFSAMEEKLKYYDMLISKR